MPGNAGGAKCPDFWRASEDGEVKVIGDEPGNTEDHIQSFNLNHIRGMIVEMRIRTKANP